MLEKLVSDILKAPEYTDLINIIELKEKDSLDLYLANIDLKHSLPKKYSKLKKVLLIFKVEPFYGCGSRT